MDELNELRAAVEERKWGQVCRLLDNGVTDAELRLTVTEAAEHAKGIDLEHIIPHCPDGMLEDVLITVLSRRCWGAVGKILDRGVSDPLRKRAVEEACKYADPFNLQSHVLRHCRDGERDDALAEIVRRRLWRVASKQIYVGVSEDARGRFLEEAGEHAREPDLIKHVLPHCRTDKELHDMLTRVVRRGSWEVAVVLLQREINQDRRKWVVQEAGKRVTSSADVMQHILPICYADELRILTTKAVHCGLWQAVGELLRKGVDENLHKWAIEEAIARASETDLTENGLLICCDDNQLQSVLRKLQERGMWRVIAHYVQHKMHPEEGPDTEVYYGRSPIKCSPESQPMEYVLLHCADEDLDFVFQTAMEQRLWRVVGALMHRPVTRELKEEAARKVITKTSRFTVVDYVAIFIPNCSRSSPLLECMLNEAVERDLWEVAGQLLEKRNVGDNRKKHAIRKACEYGTDFDVDTHILPKCSGDLLAYANRQKSMRRSYDFRRFCRLIWRYYFSEILAPESFNMWR